LGILAGLALVVVSGGGALAVGIGLGLGLASGALTIASMAVAGHDNELSKQLGIAGDVIGLIDMAAGIGTSIFSAAKAGKSIAGAAEGGFTTWGKATHTRGTIRTDVLPEFVAYMDTGVITRVPQSAAKKGSRLNIMVHGDVPAANAEARAMALWDSVQLHYLYPKKITNYEGIRLISCNAGAEGNVASHLARISGRPVKSYIGDVTTRSAANAHSLAVIERGPFKKNVVIKPPRMGPNEQLKRIYPLDNAGDYQVTVYQPDGRLSDSYLYAAEPAFMGFRFV
jgi:hypothetical protein